MRIFQLNFFIIGPKAKEAIPALIIAWVECILDSPDLQVEYTYDFSNLQEMIENALEKIDPNWAKSEAAQKAIFKLIKALSNEAFDVRESAANSLGKIGTKAEEAIPALKLALRDRNFNVREAAEKALNSIEPGWAKLR